MSTPTPPDLTRTLNGKERDFHNAIWRWVLGIVSAGLLAIGVRNFAILDRIEENQSRLRERVSQISSQQDACAGRFLDINSRIDRLQKQIENVLYMHLQIKPKGDPK